MNGMEWLSNAWIKPRYAQEPALSTAGLPYGVTVAYGVTVEPLLL